MNLPLISAIIPAYNAEAFLARAVESLLATNYPALQIVIVDDGSVDRTFDIAETLRYKHPSRIRVYQHAQAINRGVSATRNLGIGRSDGQLICFLDADDYVYPHRFEFTIAPLIEDDGIDGVFGITEMEFRSEQEQASWALPDRIFGLAEPVSGCDLLRNLMRGRVWATSGILVRRKLLERTGLFDEHLRIAEDCHLWWRMACLGRVVAGDLSAPVSVYYRHGGNTFHTGTDDNTLTMLQALLRLKQWADEHTLDEDRQQVVCEAVDAWARHTLIRSRERNEPQFVFKAIRQLAVSKHCRPLLNLTACRILLWAIQHRVWNW